MLLCVTGCGESAGSAIEYWEWAERVRQLEWLEDVRVTRLTPDEFASSEQAAADAVSDEEIAELHETYGRLGFFGPDLDVRATLGSSSSWVAGTYSYETNEIVLVGDVPESVIVHEHVHALQDQHFGLAAYDDGAATTDELMARRAVVEGDASLAEARFVMRREYGVDLDELDWSRFFSSLRDQSATLLLDGGAPPFFLAYPAFAYSHGVEYCAHNLVGATVASPRPVHDPPYFWVIEDDLFTTRPPDTTERVLDLDFADGAVAVGLDDVPATLAPRLTAVDWDSLGAWYTYLLVLPLAGTPGLGGVDEVRPTWDGDRALFVHDEDTGAFGTSWASVWDDESAAAHVEVALWHLYGATADGLEPRAGIAADGEPVWIERRVDRVVAIKNVDPALAPVLAEASLDTTASAKSLRPRTRPSLAAWQRRRHP